MIVTHEINMDLMNRGIVPIIEAVQDDCGSRRLAICLRAGGAAWEPPDGVNAIVRYIKSDGRGGEYDRLPDGTRAWTVSANVLTVELAPQVLNVAGPVKLSVALVLDTAVLHTFQILVHVQPDVTAKLAASENYKNVAAFLPMPVPAKTGQYVRIGEVDDTGVARETEGVDLEAELQLIRNVIDAKGDSIGIDPETGLLHLMRDGEKLDHGVELEGDGLAFNGGCVDEGGYLHLTLDGADIDGFQPFYVGTEGAEGYGSVIRLTTSLESRVLSILDSAQSCVLPYTWTSTDGEDGSPTGSGTAIWTVNSAQAAVRKVEQGAGDFDVRPYLTAGGENTVRLTIRDAYGAARSMVFTVTVIGYGLGWDLDEMACHGSDHLLARLTPTGSGTKTVKVTVDGAEVFHAPVALNGRSFPVVIPAQAHGAHTILAWVETEADGETLTSEPLRHVGVWLEDGNTAPVAAVLEPEMTVGQYGTAAIKFLVAEPGAETTGAELRVGDRVVSTLSGVPPTVQTWAYKARSAGTEELRVCCGDASAAVALTVTAPDDAIAPVTAGLVLDIDPAGHSNSEADRASFGYTDGSGVVHPFAFSENFDWVRGGFQQDEAGVTAFVVRRGTSVTADRSLFADDPKTSGKAIKLIFRAVNVRDPETELLRCVSGNVGLRLQARQAVIGSGAETMTVPYCEDRKIEMDINIEAESENSLAYVCLKAVPACPPVRYSGADNWTQTDPAMLTIGSEDADVWIYRVKLYGNSLSRYEILDNYIADCADPEEMAARRARNDIFGDDGTISISRLTERNTRLRAVQIRAGAIGGGETVTADVEVTCLEGGEYHHLIARDAGIRAGASMDLDVDFSLASSWTDGSGTALEAYAFTGGSIPAARFTLLADLESSDCADSVLLSDDYNTYNPAPFAGKSGGVRDCIEGHPCAVFFTNTADTAVTVGTRTVAAGETVLCFAGNMANAGDDAPVYGWNSEKWPRQCCVEVLRDDAPQCLFRSDDLSGETWDGTTGNFRFVFPESPTGDMLECFRAMQAWVVSTAVDLATGAALDTPVTYGEITYEADTADYRQAKFLAEFDDYFLRDQMLFHFLFTQRHDLTGGRVGKLFLCYDYYDEAGGYRWSARRGYDHASAYTWGREGTESTLWANMDALMQAELQRVYRANRDAWDSHGSMDRFTGYQAVTPEAVRMEDMWNKYFTPLLAGDTTFLNGCWGTGEYRRAQFETCQGVYMDSKYLGEADHANCITLRAGAGDLAVTPVTDLYITALYGDTPVRVRAQGNTAAAISCPVASMTDTRVRIFPASHLAELGSLAELMPESVALTRAERLRVLPIGSDGVGYQNPALTALGLEGCSGIEYLDLRGLPNLTGMMDLSALTELEAFYGSGSGITGLAFAQGAPLRTARVPAVGSFTARDLSELETFVMDGSALTSLRVENCPAIDTLALCKAAAGLAWGRLTGVDWTDENPDLLLRLTGLKGLDARGRSVDRFVLTGKVRCDVICLEEFNAITAAFPELAVDWGQVVPSYTVTFRNWDGTVYEAAAQTVRSGGTARNPVTAGLIPTPARVSTVAENFTFIGWDGALTDITADTVLTARFAARTRYYTVNFWSDEAQTSLLQRSVVAAWDGCDYEGEDPVCADGGIWTGWDSPTDSVVRDMDVHAVFVQPELPDTAAAEFDYLYSNDPADSSAYTAAQFYGILYHGRERDFFALGDRIRLVCDAEGFADMDIVLELRSYQHFLSAERTGQWAGPYFGMVGLMSAAHQMNAADTNTGGFAGSAMAAFLNDAVLGGLPRFIRSMIERITVCSTAGDGSADLVSMETSLTLESAAEVGAANYESEVAEGAEETAFGCYTDNESRVKRSGNGDGTAAAYWLRSPAAENGTQFCRVSADGAQISGSEASGVYGVSFGFCLRSALEA